MHLNTGSAFSVAAYCFVPPLRKAKFSDVPLRAIVKVGSAVGKERRLRNTSIEDVFLRVSQRTASIQQYIAADNNMKYPYLLHLFEV